MPRRRSTLALALLAALSLSLASPAGAQTAADVLFANGCRWACVCTTCPALRCETLDLSVPYRSPAAISPMTTTRAGDRWTAITPTTPHGWGPPGTLVELDLRPGIPVATILSDRSLTWTGAGPESPWQLPANNWPRWGFRSRPVNISDGTHCRQCTEARAALLGSGELSSGYRWTPGDDEDLSRIYCRPGSTTSAAQSAREFILARWGGVDGGTSPPLPAPACPSGWRCPPTLPEDVRVGCLPPAVLHCSVSTGVSLDDPRCYREAGLVLGKPWVQVTPRCDWRTVPPPPPPPPDPCGDRTCDAAAGETHASCPADCDSPEPPPPPEGDECDSALDALRDALEAAQGVCRG